MPGGARSHGPTPAARLAGTYELAFQALILISVLYMSDVFTLILPLPEERAEGSPFNRFFWIVVFASALPVLIWRVQRAVRLAVASWLLFAFVAVCFVSQAGGEFSGIGLRRTIAFLIVFVIALAYASVTPTPTGFLRLLGGAFAIVTLLDAMHLANGASWTALGFRGFHFHKNVAGLLLLLALLTFIGLLLIVRNRLIQLGLLALSAMALAMIALSQSKTSQATIPLLLLILPYYIVLSQGDSRRVRTTAIVSAIGGVSLLVALAGYHGVGLFGLYQTYFGDVTFTSRTEIWSRVWMRVLEQPFLGYGFGAYWDVGADTNRLQGPPYEFWNDPLLINQAHNGFLDLVLNGGAISLLVALLCVARGLFLCTRLIAASEVDGAAKIVFVVLHAQILAFLVNNTQESSLFAPASPRGYILVFVLFQLERWSMALDLHRRRMAGRPGPARRHAASAEPESLPAGQAVRDL